MKKVRVALVVNDLLVGGAQAVVLGIAQYLDRSHFEPVVYYLRDFEGERKTFKNKFEDIGVRTAAVLPGGKAHPLQALLPLRRLFANEQIDIVHAHLPDAVAAAGGAAISCRLPLIIHEHQTHEFHSYKIRFMYKILRPYATTTICYTDSVEKELFGSSNILLPDFKDLSRTCSIFNGVDTAGIAQALVGTKKNEKREEVGVPENSLIIFSAARFVAWKGHRLLLEAFGKIAHHYGNAHLVIVGDGPEREHCIKRTEELGLENQVHLLGSRTDVYELLAIADIFSLAFEYPEGMDAEAIGIAGFEGMAAGLPVIIGDYVSAKTFLGENERGLIVSPRNMEALALALSRLLDNQALREKLGQAAKKFVDERLSWAGQIKIYQKIYEIIAI